MKLSPIIALALFVASCASPSIENAGSCACADHFNSLQTSDQGTADARRHVRDNGFRILRYDMPGIRSGYWVDYYRPFRHFGIEESNEYFASLVIGLPKAGVLR
ncbi:hypothetical protein SAMN02745181_1214 [Rubritalea squalenifaciens DSM 18772]|uniref:Uncharacterized protein n=1 Tax=Rubritalea squalenifaciens DSM 18772 TaxID=1123071 RepID=A0A1M6GMZ4_9BACT|nr:hypothetical protein [Rubritalea squalenifaciens]SHJ11347.1 hypothetical protein SAMN02745181_1214 [Rubritalea squalenifaciens DSM 18772]